MSGRPAREPDVQEAGFYQLLCMKHARESLGADRKLLIAKAWADAEVRRIACQRPERLSFALVSVCHERGPVCCWGRV